MGLQILPRRHTPIEECANERIYSLRSGLQVRVLGHYATVLDPSSQAVSDFHFNTEVELEAMLDQLDHRLPVLPDVTEE